ncbi:MAG: hypothetical protein HFI36_02840 [Bacilli bacterium]|jgi:hypothetical protein|nr:hypothetical protein [Bacilli bacterium]
MNKPLQMRLLEFDESLIKLINESEIPAFILKISIEKILKQLEIIERKQLEISIKEYEKYLKEESEKDGDK